MNSMTRYAVPVLWLAFFALGVRSVAQDGDIHRLGVPARAGEGEGPLDWVYERVASSSDSWSGERSSDEVKEILGRFSDWLGKAKVPAGALEKLLAPGFQAAALLPAEGKATADQARNWRALRVRGGESPLRAASAEEFQRRLLSLGAACGRVTKAAFKIFRVSAGENSIQTDVLLELDGVSAGGDFLQVRTSWRMQWLGNSEVRLKSLQRLEDKKY